MERQKEKINPELIENHQLEYWSEKLHVGKKELAEAILKFGNDPDVIKNYFRKRRN